MGHKLNRIRQLLVYADDVNVVGDKTHIIRKKTEVLTDTSNEVILEVNTQKIKHILYHHRKAG
jgi:hypothetical protein